LATEGKITLSASSSGGASSRTAPAASRANLCAESWEDIELYGRSKQAWRKTFLALPNGIPSHDTSWRAFMLIDPDAFEATTEGEPGPGHGSDRNQNATTWQSPPSERRRSHAACASALVAKAPPTTR
jgi:hypothetical protein